MLSQNVAVVGKAPPHDDDEFAPGHGLAEILRARLLGDGWLVSEPDAWRGSGWSLGCKSEGQELEIALVAASDSEWILQIVPIYVPGWVGRLQGKGTSATPTACYTLARSVHSALVSLGGWSQFRWCWDADPWSSPTTAEPTPPASEEL